MTGADGALIAAVVGVALVVVGVVVALARRPSGAVADGGVAAEHETHAAKPAGVLRWLTTVDHADIGVLYLLFGLVAGLWGATDAMMIRAELFTPGATLWPVRTYNALFTTHGLTMLFFFVTPVFFGFGNYLIPVLIGADDMAFPRLNAVAFWLLPPSFALVRAGLVTEVLGKVVAAVGPRLEVLFALEPPTTGWTLYVPNALQLANPQVDVLLLGLHLSGVATTMGAINFIVTVGTERDPAVGWDRVDIFTWTVLTAAGLILFAFPVLGSAVVMLLLDRNFGTAFFAVGSGGPILWQHLFWFFGHPEVYILALPALGLVSYILPKFAGRKLFGFRFVVYSTLAIGVLSFGVWAHHMFVTGMDPRLRASFMAVTVAIAIPSAVKTFNWIATLWNGRVRLTAPMLCCVGAASLFVVGGVTGVFLAAIPVDVELHATYYVVGHFHFIVVGVIAFAMFGASYFWFPLLTGRLYDRRLARLHVALVYGGSLLTFGPMLVLGYAGLPRRFAEYPATFVGLQQLATVGALLLGLAVLVWLLNMVQSYRTGPVVTDGDPWDLAETDQCSREWQWLGRRIEERRKRQRR